MKHVLHSVAVMLMLKLIQDDLRDGNRLPKMMHEPKIRMKVKVAAQMNPNLKVLNKFQIFGILIEFSPVYLNVQLIIIYKIASSYI